MVVGNIVADPGFKAGSTKAYYVCFENIWGNVSCDVNGDRASNCVLRRGE